MSTRRTSCASPFAALIDPAGTLEACQKSVRLKDLPSTAYLRADRPSSRVSPEVAEFDAHVDAAIDGAVAAGRRISGIPINRRRATSSTAGVEGSALADAIASKTKPTGSTASTSYSGTPQSLDDIIVRTRPRLIGAASGRQR